MDKKDKKTPKNKKLKKILLIAVSSILVLSLLIYLLFIFTHKDKGRDNHDYSDTSSVSLIDKNMVDAFKDTKNTGKISFSLSDDDINQMLHNASNHVLSDKQESLYFESKGNNTFAFYVDLKPTLGVKTRIEIETTFEGYSSSGDSYLKVSHVSMGKLPYTHKDKYLNESFFLEIAKYSLLPISYSESSNKIRVSSYSFLEYFPDGELFDVIKELVNSKKDILSPSNTSLFGFNIDLSSFRNVNHKSSANHIEVDLLSRVKSKLTEEYLDTFTLGDSKVVDSISLDEYNSLLSESMLNNDSCTLSSDLTLNKVELKVKELYSSLDVDEITYTFVLDINEYEIDVNVKSLEVNKEPDFNLNVIINNKVNVGEIIFEDDSYIGNMFLSFLKNAFTVLDDTYSIFTYISTSKLLNISFKEAITSLDYMTSSFAFDVGIDNINLDRFNLIVTKK